ncbi:MAG: baseplate J/gp47 family protein, partial [Chloroflexota bacterium]|nr:baseplate J/gp47 family protein [Chloroflexota bacterium]
HPSWPTPEKRLGQSRVTLPPGDLATSKPWREEAVDASAGVALPPRPVPRPEYAMEPRTGAIGKQEPDARARTKPATIISIVLSVAVALTIAGFLSVWLRTAEIVVRTPRQPVSTELTVGYSTDGSQVPGTSMTFPAEMTEFAVPYTGTFQATGTREDSSGKATGTVELRNISGAEVQLPAGTRLERSDGIAFLTTEAATIPTGDPEEPGRAEVAVAAEASGAAGNLAAGVFTGAIASVPGVYFSNVAGAFVGGNDVVIPVVTDADLSAAREVAVAELATLAATYQLPDGRVVIPSTVQLVREASVETDQIAGAEVEAFYISAQATYQALTIDPNDLPDAIEAQVRAELANAVPDGYVLTDDQIRFGQPVEGPAGSGTITVSASIDAYQALTGDLVEQVREVTAGKDQDEARDALATVPGIEVVSISVSPNLIVDTLPGRGKIDVEAE